MLEQCYFVWRNSPKTTGPGSKTSPDFFLKWCRKLILTFEKTLKRNRKNDALFNGVVCTGFALFCLLIVYPFYYMVINSFNGDLYRGTAFLWPPVWSTINYEVVFGSNSLLRTLIVSVLRVASGSVITVAICSTAAFALRKRSLKIRWFYLIMFTIPMFFGGGLIPNFLILKYLGLIDTFLVYILPRAWNFFYIIIFMSCFNDIDDAMEESAIMDGANHLTVFIRIYLPMSVPVMVTILLFAGVFHWGAWFDSIYFTKRIELQTIAAFLVRIINRVEVYQMFAQARLVDDLDTISIMGVRFATITVAIVPVLLVYPFIQKYFVRGIRLGSIKG